MELDLSAIASAATNAARNGLKMDTYYPQEVGYRIGVAFAGVGECLFTFLKKEPLSHVYVVKYELLQM